MNRHDRRAARARAGVRVDLSRAEANRLKTIQCQRHGCSHTLIDHEKVGTACMMNGCACDGFLALESDLRPRN